MLPTNMDKTGKSLLNHWGKLLVITGLFLSPMVYADEDISSFDELSGARNLALVNQIGYSHSADISQQGMSNELYLAQTGYNTSLIASQQGVSNEILLLQSGSDIEASIQQTGYGNLVIANQLGTALEIDVTQNGYGNQAYIYQTGYENSVWIQQWFRACSQCGSVGQFTNCCHHSGSYI